MQRRRSRAALTGVLALALSVTVGTTLGGVADAAKKKGKKVGPANVTVAVNQVVPPATVGPPFRNGILTSTAVVGKKYRGRQVADVNATVQYNVSGPGSDLGDLALELTAPNGATSLLVASPLFGTTVGPLTLDDETPLFVSSADPADFQDPDRLFTPYIGKSQPNFIPLSVMDGGPARGTWTLKVRNVEDIATEVHTFGSWSLQIQTRRPFVQKP